jgi:peptidyl-prolyl cis-trans isomerase, FKBP-type
LFNAKQAALIAQKEAELKAKNEAFLAENKKKEGVVVLPDGLQYRIIKKGTGATPKASDAVRVVYEGKTIDGKVFDATSKHGAEYDTFNVGGLIKGWTEVLQLMPVGSKWEVFIPQDLAYGSRGAGKDIAPYSTLIFTLELKGIEPATVAMPEAVKKVKETPVTKTSPAKKVAKKTVKK